MFDFTELLCHKNKIYILSDKAVKNELMKLHHDDVLAEHYEVDRMINLLFRKYYWVNMMNDVWEYVALCAVCLRIQVSRHCLYDKLQLLSLSIQSWKKITMNMITDLLPSRWGANVYDFILIIVNHLTKMTQYISVTKKLTVIKLADIYIEQIICCYEELRSIVSDWESIFISAYWFEFCYQL